MDKEQAKSLIIRTFEDHFNKERFTEFISNLLKKYNREKTFVYQGDYIPDAFKPYIESLEWIGQYTYDDKEIDILIVQLKKETSLERARTMQRNFIAWYLKGSISGKLREAALVAFVSPTSEDWRFSLVKMDYRFEETPTGKIEVKEEFTSARRWSFLVGKNEKSHTAQSRFIPILENDEWKPTLEDLEEAFNVEVVTKEFFQKYRDLFIRTKLELDKILISDIKVKQEFERKNINTVDFAKRLLGQIVFLYFLQKKGWFGVEKGKPWGSGPKDFMRRLFNKDFVDYRNFYNDILEPLFYEALRTDRSSEDHYYSRFNCKIPFLNGGLFDPIGNFDWVNIDLLLPNELFSNENRTKEGDIGDGILDVFDRYNFTVNEEEPLEKEVALDPELLGKIYEKLNAIRPDNFDEYVRVLKSGKTGEETKFNKEYGVYYTPREIVHYMCQESLINYLESSTGIPACDIEKFIKIADSVREIEIIALEREEKIKEGVQKSTRYESQIPETIKENAKKIDALLADIKVCDPAVGSGAFPVGMMHEIVKLRQLLSIYCFTDIPVCGSNTAIPVCGSRSNTDIPVCGSNTDIPVCGSNTAIPVCESNTNIPVCEHDDLHITHRNLPHWTKSGSIYWITFRLADSLPQEKINQWKEEYEIWSKNNPKPLNEKQWEEYNKKFGNKFENWLDAGYGSCILSKPEIREKVKECIMKFDNEKLKIHAVVIMPNHVHLLIEPFPGYSLSEILKGIKGASAREINKILGITGNKIWMEESYDHIVRSEKEYCHFIQYIFENPKKANLSEDKYWLYVSQALANVTQAFLPEVTQAFLPVKETRASLPEENKSQTRMSVLHHESQTRMSVLHCENSYDLKRHCIENSLYGVDIDPGAVEICKLRFWLSLIVDEENFYNIKPLPNLDYKVVCGDSLLGFPENWGSPIEQEIENLMDEYFNETNSSKKQELKNKIDEKIKWRFEKSEKTFGYKINFDFRLLFPKVFREKGGFDVVIENPPYVRQERIRNYKPLLERAGYQVFNATSDL
ncbi:MAG: transposase, partial [Candidatus Omnitrophica bacterium]|nr:transposase [Candidatus Omnitrophota bacterium]